MGFTHQPEEPWRWRRRIKPVVEQVGVDDRRLPVVDVGELRGGRRRDDGEGLEDASVVVPVLPERGERQRRSVRKGQKIGLLALPAPFATGTTRWPALSTVVSGMRRRTTASYGRSLPGH